VPSIVLIVVSLVVGAALALGATFATTEVLSKPPAPANRAAYNYGG
jgi:hypothetical protein